MNKNSQTEYFTELERLSAVKGQEVSNFPQITKLHATNSNTGGNLSITSGFSANITVKGYNLYNTKKVFLSASDQSTITGGHNIKSALTAVDLFSTYSSLSTTFQSFSGFEVTSFKVVDNQRITLDIPAGTAGTILNVILVSPIGHSVPFTHSKAIYPTLFDFTKLTINTTCNNSIYPQTDHFNIQYSDDGNTWVTVTTIDVEMSVAPPNGGEKVATASWNPVGARQYWRLYKTGTTSDPGKEGWDIHTIKEMQWSYSSATTAGLFPTGYWSFSGTDASNGDYINDGNINTEGAQFTTPGAGAYVQFSDNTLNSNQIITYV